MSLVKVMDAVVAFLIVVPCCGASNQSPDMRRSINALDTTITRFGSS